MRYAPKSTARVLAQFNTLSCGEVAGTAFDLPELVPVAIQSGPLVFVPELSDGHMLWPPVWAVVLGPVALAYGSFGRLRVMRASKVAEFLFYV